MNKGIKIFSTTFFSLVVTSLVLPNLALAADCVGFKNNPDKPASLDQLTCVFGDVISVIAALGGIFTFLVIIMGAFKYITSAGDPKAAASAKGTITWGIGGFIAILLSYFILKFISDYTGFNVLNFTIPAPATP